MTKANLSKTYNPKDFEQRLYQEWVTSNQAQIQTKNHSV